jgi:hypothetical protein
MQLPPDFKKFIELMNSAAVRYVMIGGYAYNLYRNPRATGDIDFLVAADEQNERRLRKVLSDFGFAATLPPPDQRLLKEESVIMLGRAPLRIDILTAISGVEFEEVFTSKREMQIDQLRLPVISPEMLLKNKTAVGRHQDLADAQALRDWLGGSGD